MIQRNKSNMAKSFNFEPDDDFTKSDSNAALSGLMKGDDGEQPRTKRKYTKKNQDGKPDVQAINIKGQQVALVTSGLLAALEGITKMPFKDVDKDVKGAFDESLAQCATIYGGEYVAKYLPLIQLGLCASVVVSTTYAKHLDNKKANTNGQEA